MEWWKSNTVTGESTSFYELTGGINYKPHANVVIRPEIRYNWTPGDEAASIGLGHQRLQQHGVRHRRDRHVLSSSRVELAPENGNI